MTKTELLQWLQDEYRQWQALLDQIGSERMEQPNVAGTWSIKDMIAHLTGWHHTLVARMQAAQGGEPEPPPPWPAQLQDDDAINAWIYETNRERSLCAVLDESHQLFQQLFAVIAALPEDIAIEPEWRVVQFGDQRFAAGEFFDHFHDDHEPDIRVWLARVEGQ